MSARRLASLDRSPSSTAARLHLGVTPWCLDGEGDADSLAGQAELAERLGLDSFWLPESHFVSRQPTPAPLVALAAVAARTRSLRLGTTSYLLPIRHPILAAEEVAVLDRLSSGRLILGIGRGFRRALFDAFGVERAHKRQRFEEAVAAMRAAWRGEPIAWEEGEDGQRRAVGLAPLPLQQPHPPLWVAAFGRKGLEQAGRLGLPYLASPLESLAALEENYRHHRAALDPAVDAAALPVPVMRTVFVAEDAALVRRVREALARQAVTWRRLRPQSVRDDAAAPVEAWALVGGRDEVGDAIVRYRERLGMTHLVVRAQVPEAPPGAVDASLSALVALRRELGLV